MFSETILSSPSTLINAVLPSPADGLISITLWDTKFDEDDVDIIVTQDNSTQTWKIRVTDSGAVKLKQNIIYITDRISFTIVQNNDPNIFYEKFDVDISIFKTTNIFETKFKYDYSKLLNTPSVYTCKLFSKYGHKVNSWVVSSK